jgi:hypothetical protein
MKMRKIALALAIGLLASAGGIGVGVDSAAAAVASPQIKVVIVVGATQGATSSYRADADAAAAVFAKYTSNIVKVYSPYATWSAVQSAATGANVLVYMGHGSGYPNPYVSYLQPNGDNGMGLNATSGAGDNNTKYYGESYMAQLGLAPNALVLLNHLCYASGDNEWGSGLPPLSTAETRVDGYASGFLRGNARAVIAEGVSSLGPYIDDLFTNHETIDQMWRNIPNFHNHVTTWPSTRNPGFTSAIDPDMSNPAPDGDYYYRSIVFWPNLTTDDVLKGNVTPARTYNPATFHPLSPPVRMLDTRSGNGLPKAKIAANTPATFAITAQTRAGSPIPAGATAVTGNVTVVNSTKSWAVYLGPDPVAKPTTSTINFAAGQITGNGLTVALSGTGTLSATYMSDGGNTTDLVFDVTGYFTPDASGATYHPMTPARLLDTRFANGLPKAPIKANTPATFYVTAANRPGSPVPAGATAVTGNVTVVDETSSWAIFLGPDPTPAPGTSTINFVKGDIKGNNLTVALGAGGSLSATYVSNAGNTTDLVFDVTGYYTADASGSRYVPLIPARLLDTRSANGLPGHLTANTPATFWVSAQNRPGSPVPAGATAVTGNVTVVNETFPWAVFLGPDPNPSPGTSTINFVRGDIKGNGLAVALGSGGGLSATYMSTTGNTTDLVFDVTGFFAP